MNYFSQGICSIIYIAFHIFLYNSPFTDNKTPLYIIVLAMMSCYTDPQLLIIREPVHSELKR